MSATLGQDDLESSGDRWVDLGQLLSRVLEHPAVRRFLGRAADAVLGTRDVLWRNTAVLRPPSIVLGGGAVRDERLWVVLENDLRSRGVNVSRVVGEPAVGLARFAMRNPDADVWGFIGRKRPAWLS